MKVVFIVGIIVTLVGCKVYFYAEHDKAPQGKTLVDKIKVLKQ